MNKLLLDQTKLSHTMAIIGEIGQYLNLTILMNGSIYQSQIQN